MNSKQYTSITTVVVLSGHELPAEMGKASVGLINRSLMLSYTHCQLVFSLRRADRELGSWFCLVKVGCRKKGTIRNHL